MTKPPPVEFSSITQADGSSFELLPRTKSGALSARKLPALTPDQARALTNEIKSRTVQLWLLVERAHSGKAYIALGYTNWKEYASAELQMSESRSFQLLDQAKVMRELAAAGVDVSDTEPIPARVVAKIKHALPEVREAARVALSSGADLHEALRALAQSVSGELSLSPASRSPRAARPDEVVCPGCSGRGYVLEEDADLLSAVRNAISRGK